MLSILYRADDLLQMKIANLTKKYYSSNLYS